MASFIAQLSRACASKSTKTVSSVLVIRRSFRFSSCRVTTTVPSWHGRRQESALATSKIPSGPALTSSPLPPQNDIQPSFSSLKGIISESILKALVGKPMSLTHMSPVQAEVLPLLPELARPYDPNEPPNSPPRDLLVKAKTGTGKTLAFLIPAVEARLQAIQKHSQQAVQDVGAKSDHHFERRAGLTFAREEVGTLIISPTRELATQIANEALRLTQHVEGFGVRLFVGGESKRLQMRGWMNGRRDIVVATPGRLRDLLMSEPSVKRGISKTRILILDEADTLLDMGFRDDIEDIKEYLPPVPERQTFLFSATVSKAIQQIARSSLAPDHKFVNCVSEDSSPVHAHVAQYHTVLPNGSHQVPHILRLLAHDQLANPGTSKVIVFLPTTKMTQLFASALRELSRSTLPAGRHTSVFEIHSKRTMEARTSTSASFRADKSGASVLVTSDVSARGVDYPGVTRVIQVGIPGGTEQYIHRVGRTGRANTQGRGDLVLLPWELGFVSTNLSMVPLKPLTTQELSSQLRELSVKFEQDPSAFFANAPISPPVHTPRNGRPVKQPISHKMIQSSLMTIIEDIERNTLDFMGTCDEETVRETFLSLLGYYVSKAQDMRIPKEEVLEGCKTWTTEACGLGVPPYVSPRLLQQVGLGAGKREKEFGRRQSMRGGLGDYGRAPPRNSWAERGGQRFRETEFGQKERGGRFARDDPWGASGSGGLFGRDEGGFGGSGNRRRNNSWDTYGGGESEGRYEGRNRSGRSGRERRF